MVNFDIAAQFLSLLDDDHAFTFQTFDDVDGEPATTAPRVRHGSLGEHAPELKGLNEAGAGIFVMVNAGDGVIRPGSKTCRTAANVVRVRALFVDLDRAPIRPLLTSALPPDFVVRSSRNRYHGYWRVDDCSLDSFGSAQAALATLFNGDTAVKDLPRVMRIPGFVHRKAEPFLSELYLPMQYNQLLEQTCAD